MKKTIKFILIIICIVSLNYASDRANAAAEKTRNERSFDTYSLGSNLTIEDIVNTIIGEGVNVYDIIYAGADEAIGLFDNAQNTGLEMTEGVILSSGSIHDAVGPNNTSGTSTNFGTQGDADLNQFVDYPTNDASVLEFRFIASANRIKIDYIFGSEEYNEYVYQFNDVFAFLINGQNIAVVPGTDTPVGIDFVNLNDNSQYFINNEIPNNVHNIEADGFTTLLSAIYTVVPGNEYSIKIAIADTRDHILDSWVFLKSFMSYNAEPLTMFVEGGTILETKEDIPLEFMVQAISEQSTVFNWFYSSPIWGFLEFIDNNHYSNVRFVRITPNSDYNGYDSFVMSVNDNMGNTVYQPIAINTIPVNDPPVNTAPPLISGDFVVNGIVAATVGNWNDDKDNQFAQPEEYSSISYEYQWQTANNENRQWENIPDAVLAVFEIHDNFYDTYIRCLVTATDNGIGEIESESVQQPSNEEYIADEVDTDDSMIQPVSGISKIYPNPFTKNLSNGRSDGRIKISYCLNEDSFTDILIFNLKGQRVAVIFSGYKEKGVYDISWDLKDSLGNDCASAIYYAQMRTNNKVSLKKFIVIR